MAQSALVVLVPEVQTLVGDLRERHDPSAAEGVPPHITVLYPFVPPEDINDAVLDGLRCVLRDVPAFSFRLSRIGRFPDTLYLAPDPADPFIRLTQCIARRFPEHPPYEGLHDTICPHLTIARGSEALDAIETVLAHRLHHHGSPDLLCSSLALIDNRSGRWKPSARWTFDALGTGRIH